MRVPNKIFWKHLPKSNEDYNQLVMCHFPVKEISEEELDNLILEMQNGKQKPSTVKKKPRYPCWEIINKDIPLPSVRMHKTRLEMVF